VRYKVSGGAEMTDYPLVRVCARPLNGVVRDSSATVVSTAMCIPFKGSSQIRSFPSRLGSSNILEQTMAMRQRDEEVVSLDSAGLDVGASSRWVAVPRHLAEE
jgi:hypothetical protein